MTPPEGQIYTLSKAVKGRRTGQSGTAILRAGNYMLVGIHGRMLEIRKEELFDMPCDGTEPPRPKKLQTYLVDAEEFYDADLHFALQPAYTRGC